MLYRAKVAVCSEINTYYIITLYGPKVNLFNVSNVGTSNRLMEVFRDCQENAMLPLSSAVVSCVMYLLENCVIIKVCIILHFHCLSALLMSSGKSMWSTLLAASNGHMK
jgi:hypothetical protein